MTRTTFHLSFFKGAVLATFATLALAGCRAEEQGRVIRYEQGVYKGKPDTQLSDAQLEELRHRALNQSGDRGTGLIGGGAGPAGGGDVRTPGEDLAKRAQHQSGK